MTSIEFSEKFNSLSDLIIVEKNSKFPTFVFYPIDRTYLEIDLKSYAYNDFDDWTYIYENAFGAKCDFVDFFKWYRNAEDKENEERLSRIDKGITENYVDTQLNAVRNAILFFIPEYSHIHISRKSQLFTLEKDGKEISLSSMSDGEKEIVTLFGDIARRLSIANPKAQNPLFSEGIIIIDEIESHLHPSWQRKIIKSLLETFPNCQFIITTHSPQVLGEIKAENIRLISEGKILTPEKSFGLSSNEILGAIMSDSKNTWIRNSDVSLDLEKIAKFVDEEKFSEARNLIEVLESKIGGSISETVEYSTMIKLLSGE